MTVNHDQRRAAHREFWHKKKSSEPVTAEYVKRVYAYDEESGRLTYRIRIGHFVAGSAAGSIKEGRLRITIRSRSYGAHRLVWLYVHGVWPVGEIDHINGNPLDNRIANLRDVSSTVNHQNIHDAPPGKKYSPLLGAQWCKQARKWKASIRVNGRVKHLGFFPSDIEASHAYVLAKRRFHEGCTI